MQKYIQGTAMHDAAVVENRAGDRMLKMLALTRLHAREGGLSGRSVGGLGGRQAM